MSDPAAHRPYVMYPDPRLRAVAEPVDAVTDEVRAIWDEMLRAMYLMPGVGLAAPQLGIGLRLAVVDCSDTKSQPIKFANPEIVSVSEKTIANHEGSPNLPGLFDKVVRPAEAEVRYTDQNGDEVTRAFDGLWAISIQHQIDHLEGKLFIDRLSPIRRQRLLGKHRKATRRKART